jgi:enoyl-CoA hydratase
MSNADTAGPAVITADHDGVLVITIQRPEAKNAVNRAVSEGLSAAVDELNTNPELRVGVLTGAGSTFCAGMDLKAFLKGENVRIEGRGFAGLAQADIDKPLIAAIEGYALAGGFELALACDLIVASTEARFGLPEVKRGLVANAGGLVRLPRQFPTRLACELVLTGAMVGAGYLAAHGLINRVVPAGTALEAALELAHVIAQNGPLAISVSKRVMRESQDWSSAQMFDRQNAMTRRVFESADAREGAIAFAEKRSPVWVNK